MQSEYGFTENHTACRESDYMTVHPNPNTSLDTEATITQSLDKGTLMHETEKNVKLKKTNATAPMPQIQEVRDCVSGTVNKRLTAGGVVELRGYGFRIDGDDPTCGLWFVPKTGEKLKATVIVENKPTRIIALIPVFPESVPRVRIKVVTQYSGGGNRLKTPKHLYYQKPLTYV